MEPNSNVVAEDAMAWVQEHRPAASPQKKAAFANSVMTLVTGWSGGYGGPSVREHAACQQFGRCGSLPGGLWPLAEALAVLNREDGPIFGPLTDLHRNCWESEHCFDDDPQDVVELDSQQ